MISRLVDSLDHTNSALEDNTILTFAGFIGGIVTDKTD